VAAPEKSAAPLCAEKYIWFLEEIWVESRPVEELLSGIALVSNNLP
jgi:hypothetical protein